jgi:6-phosphogluconolactonase
MDANGHARVERRVPRPELVPELLPFPDAGALSRAAAELVAEIAEAAVAARGRFTMALSGGHTPESLYRMLAGEYRDRMPWAETHLYFGDERCVPPTDPDSNYRMAEAALVSRVPGLEGRTHRIEGERAPVDAAARYDALLRAALTDEAATFDLVLLGMGPDGHTASLFPGSPALEERERWAVATEAPPTMATRARVTLTYPVLTASRIVLFLCAGADKRERLAAVLADTGRPDAPYPASRMTARERLVWLVDDAAMP